MSASRKNKTTEFNDTDHSFQTIEREAKELIDCAENALCELLSINQYVEYKSPEEMDHDHVQSYLISLGEMSETIDGLNEKFDTLNNRCIDWKTMDAQKYSELSFYYEEFRTIIEGIEPLRDRLLDILEQAEKDINP